MRKQKPSSSNELFKAGGRVESLSISLRVRGNDVDPDQLTRLLGLTPTFSARKGERRVSGRKIMVQPVNIWVHSRKLNPEQDFNEAVHGLLDEATSDLNVWHNLHEQFSVDFFVGLFLNSWNKGLQISSDVLNELSRRHLTLSLDIYRNA